jgi:hypothetical protein
MASSLILRIALVQTLAHGVSALIVPITEVNTEGCWSP